MVERKVGVKEVECPHGLKGAFSQRDLERDNGGVHLGKVAKEEPQHTVQHGRKKVATHMPMHLA